MTVAEDKNRRKELEDKNANKNNIDVYFLGFDSLSHMSFRRKLKKTVKVLEETIGSFVLNGIILSRSYQE